MDKNDAARLSSCLCAIILVKESAGVKVFRNSY